METEVYASKSGRRRGARVFILVAMGALACGSGSSGVKTSNHDAAVGAGGSAGTAVVATGGALTVPSTGGIRGTGGTPDTATGGRMTGGVSSVGGQDAGGTGGKAQTGGVIDAGAASGGAGGESLGGNRQTGGVVATGGTTGLGGQGDAGLAGNRQGGAIGTGGLSGTGGRPSTGGVAATGGVPASCAQPANAKKLIAFGTKLDPQAQMCESQALAKSIAAPGSATWRAKGDQNRKYRFQAANADVGYRICIPPSWDGTSKLPMLVFLHSGFGNENTNLDENNKLLVNLAFQHGYALVSPLGYQGAYGNFLALPAVFGQQASADQQIAAITAATERTNELSEKDVINVIEIMLNEYPIDRDAMFLTGHSMGAGGTWYIGAKYPGYWKALATLSGPFVQESGYLWDAIKPKPNLITEGTSTAGLAGSRAVYAYMQKNGFTVQYKEVVADHGGMIPIVLPDVFAFFNGNRPR